MIALVVALLAAAAPEAPAAGAAAQTAQPPAAEAAAQPPAAEAKPASKKAKDDQVCWEETPTGTRFPQRYCADRQELKERTLRDQDWKNRIQDVPVHGN
jgi:hypothetical protein